MSFSLGPKSQAELTGVHPQLVVVVQRAIQISLVDFAVHDGLRTAAEQDELVRRGASKTMNSKHRIQADGYGHAVDLVPVINGKLRWEWPPIYSIASAVRIAAKEQRVRLRWGGVWDCDLADLGQTPIALERDVQAYARRHPGPDFLDGPHFELISGG